MTALGHFAGTERSFESRGPVAQETYVIARRNLALHAFQGAQQAVEKLISAAGLKSLRFRCVHGSARPILGVLTAC
jgi:hypothetical protein